MLTRASAIVCRQTLFKASIMSQEVATRRYIHLVRQVRKTPRSLLLDLQHRSCRVVGVPLVRYASTNESTAQSIESASSQAAAATAETTAAPETAALQTSPYDEIPDPPTPIQEIIETLNSVHPNGEATFQSLGLGGWSPVGLVQQFLEFAHISGNVPWWATIVIGTLCVRIFMFPLVVMAQKNMIKFSNHMPTIQDLQLRMTDARQAGDHMESARAATELMQYMKTNKISAMKNIMMPLIQAPIFISFFLALRQMANAPVESLKEGGFWWVTDLTIHDPYYVLPIVTSVTMYCTIELGADGANLKAMGMMRYVLRALPFVILPFMINFPATILTYWMSTNFISLLQTGFLKIPYIRKKFNMPTLSIKASNIHKNKKGFVSEFKESWTNMKISKQLDNREQADAIQFNRAGKGPLIKTFKYNPTKQKEASIYAKKR